MRSNRSVRRLQQESFVAINPLTPPGQHRDHLRLRPGRDDGLIHAESQVPLSLTLFVALLVLAIGVLAILSMIFNAGPFG